MTTLLNEQLPSFKHVDLKMVVPDFDSELTDLIMNLEYLRKLVVTGTTPKSTFFQIKSIFHVLESIGSARIEGNRTTIIEYFDKKLENNSENPDSFKEIENMEKTLRFIDENVDNAPIDRAFISELHKKVVHNLAEEGSRNPGYYRKLPVIIRNSNLVPPPFVAVPSYMDELFEFISKIDAPKYDLIKIALAHHRFAWIHPFDNGNGRTARMFTYALFVKLGFKIYLARIINPTAIFCCDREKYYSALSRADRGDREGLLLWIAYMLSGLKNELEKTDRLTDYEYLKAKILLPAIEFSLDKNIIDQNEALILNLAIQRKEIANSDVKENVFPSKSVSHISHILRNLIDKKYLRPIEGNKRKYSIHFRDTKLIRGIISSLDHEGFLPVLN